MLHQAAVHHQEVHQAAQAAIVQVQEVHQAAQAAAIAQVQEVQAPRYRVILYIINLQFSLHYMAACNTYLKS